MEVSQHTTMALTPRLAVSPVARYFPLSERVMQVMVCLKILMKNI